MQEFAPIKEGKVREVYCRTGFDESIRYYPFTDYGGVLPVNNDGSDIFCRCKYNDDGSVPGREKSSAKAE